jgi:uroporphyrinogen decarboxylase
MTPDKEIPGVTTSRERVLQTLNFQVPDRLPKDLGGMRSTCISAFAYPRLVEALGLPPRVTRVEDTGQMLALPDLDVLDALGIDIVAILDGVTNAFDQPELWRPYDFNGRLPAQVLWPENFVALPDGSILQGGKTRMVLDSFVFDEEHAGQPLDLSDDLPKLDLVAFRKEVQGRLVRDDKVVALRELCSRVRASSDRAIFFNDGSLGAPLGIGAYSGLAIFPMLCITEPDYVTELHEIVTEAALKNIRALLPEIRDDIDIIMMSADDWGTQNNLIASPRVYRNLFLPYYRRINDECHRIAPQVKLFLHCCGAVYDLIDLVVESHFDILNPVQWPAGGHSYREWKDRARGRLALWGGGVNAQVTLALGSVEDVRQEVSEVTQYMQQDGGYVFCNIHNILAEIAPEKVIAMYQAAGTG